MFPNFQLTKFVAILFSYFRKFTLLTLACQSFFFFLALESFQLKLISKCVGFLSLWNKKTKEKQQHKVKNVSFRYGHWIVLYMLNILQLYNKILIGKKVLLPEHWSCLLISFHFLFSFLFLSRFSYTLTFPLFLFLFSLFLKF